jgi:hypothetical protein
MACCFAPHETGIASNNRAKATVLLNMGAINQHEKGTVYLFHKDKNVKSVHQNHESWSAIMYPVGMVMPAFLLCKKVGFREFAQPFPKTVPWNSWFYQSTIKFSTNACPGHATFIG